MKAVLFAPGPSLSRAPAEIPADVAIGVNRAAIARGVGFWVCLDSPALKRFSPLIRGKPRLLTRAENRPKHTAMPGPTVEEVQAWCPSVEVTHYSAVAGLALAGWLGATDVTVYGADWTDAADFDGYRCPDANRDAARWDRERRHWEALTAYLFDRGVKVKRCP
jgi:hypothetical protein